MSIMGILKSIAKARSDRLNNVQSVAGSTHAMDVVNRARTIVADYGDALAEENAAWVQDVRMLPHSKDQIKTALEVLIRVGADEAMKEHLKVSYLGLSVFQPLNAELVGSVRRWEQMNAGKIDADPAAMVECGRDVVALQAKIAAEMDALKNDLQAKGVW